LKIIVPKSEEQERFLNLIDTKPITICLGMNATGKTFLALYKGLQHLQDSKSKIKRIVCMTPLISEKYGEDRAIAAIPGDITEKILPYNMGVIDAIEHILSESEYKKVIEGNIIRFEAMSLLRGRSIRDTYIYADECQLIKKSGGSSAIQLLLTRMSANSKIVITADPYNGEFEQTDLYHIIQKIKHIDDIGICTMENPNNTFRHPVVKKVLNALYPDQNNRKDISEWLKS